MCFSTAFLPQPIRGNTSTWFQNQRKAQWLADGKRMVEVPEEWKQETWGRQDSSAVESGELHLYPALDSKGQNQLTPGQKW